MPVEYVSGDDHVVTITINRPEARNSMDMEHFYQLRCADQIPAARAFEMGLLNAVCRPADLMERAYDYAHRNTANGPFAVRKTKE